MFKRLYLRNSDGFAMIAVLLALLILIGISALVFTMTTKDIRVTTRTVGEKKAYSAAQSAVAHAIADALSGPGATSGGNPTDPSTWPQVNPLNDADTRYYYAVSASASGCQPIVWADLKEYVQDVYVVDARGANTRYQTQVLLDTSMGVFRAGNCSMTSIR